MPKNKENNKPQTPVKLIDNYELDAAIKKIRHLPGTGIPALTPADRATLHTLTSFLTSCDDAFDRDNRVNPSLRTIADDIGIEKSAAMKRIARLRQAGWIYTEEQLLKIRPASDEVKKTSSRYYFSPALILAAHASNLHTVRDEEDQEDEFKTAVDRVLSALERTKTLNIGSSSENGRLGLVAKEEKSNYEIANEIALAVENGQDTDNLIQLFSKNRSRIAGLKQKLAERRGKSGNVSTPLVDAFRPITSTNFRHTSRKTSALSTHINPELDIQTLNKSHCEKPKSAARKKAAPELSEILNKLDSLDIFSRFSKALGQKQEVPSARKQFAKSIAKSQNLDETLSLVESNLALLESIPPLQTPREDGKNHSLGRLLSEQLSAVADKLEARHAREVKQQTSDLSGSSRGRVIVEMSLRLGWCPHLAYSWLTKSRAKAEEIENCIAQIEAENNPKPVDFENVTPVDPSIFEGIDEINISTIQEKNPGRT